MTQVIGYTLPEHLAARRAAQRSERIVQLIGAVVAVVCFSLAGLLIRPVNEIRKDRQLVIDPASIKGLPPTIALVGKLATFRALAIDWAAIRAERLKEEGKDYEALELHKTVCALAPRFPKLWVYAAWNMAYNISVNQYSPEERWQWVRNGIEILRDEGIQYNPRSVTLYKELAWIYWHKIGDFLDDYHMGYKRALAVEMERVLGPPPISLDEREYFSWFRRIVDAPRDLKTFIESNPEIAALVDELRKLDLKLDLSLLEFVARHIRPELNVADVVKEQQDSDALDARRLRFLTAEQHKEGLDRLLAAVRSEVLRKKYKFDLDWMFKLMVEDYGPLDWRNAFSHSLYWSSYGDHISKGYARTDPADAMNTARFVFFSLQNLITRGRMILFPNFDDPMESYLELSPDTRYIPYLFQTYLRLGKEQFGDDPRFVEGTPGPNYMTGMVTNMEQWIQLLYFEGGDRNRELAENLYAWLREHNPHPDGSTQERYTQTLDDFVMGQILAQLDTWRAASAIVRQFVRRALKLYSLANPQGAVGAMALARKCYDYWMNPTAGDINERRKLEPPEIILRDEIISFMQDPRYDPIYKARLWQYLPLRQRQMSYDALSAYFARLCAEQDPPWALERAFPEPPDMARFRRERLEYRSPRRKGVSEGERFKN